MITLFAPAPRTALIICCIPATGYEMPVQGLPVSQHCQPVVVLPVARNAYGSLNKSKTTASLPLKVFATDVQNAIACAESGIGFWHTACADVQPADGPVYCPSVQCRSKIATMPLEFSRLT